MTGVLHPARSGGGHSAGAACLVPMPRSVRALLDALSALPPRAEGQDRLIALDHLAARAVTALSRFTDQASTLIPPQRALLLLGGRPGVADDAVYGLVAALRRIDAGLGDQGGFSRLLESALEAGEVQPSQRLSSGQLPEDLRPLAERLEDLARRLSTLDDLAHATQSRSVLTGGAMLATFVLDEAARVSGSSEEDRLAEGQAWVRHRGASTALASLLPFEAGLESLDEEVVTLAERARVSRAFALWVLAERLSSGGGVDRGDRAPFDRLLASGGLWPTAVFEKG